MRNDDITVSWVRRCRIAGVVFSLLLASPVLSVRIARAQTSAPADSPLPPPATATDAPTAAPALAGTPSSPATVVPARPDEPRAAKAYSVFEAHCASCHQTGRTDKPLASGGLANILAVDDLARDPLAVRPGLPDASPIYDVLVTRHAPLDIYTDASEGTEPRPDDIETVRDWIRDLDPAVQTCPERKPMATTERDALIREAQRLERDASKDLRFVSLAHLYNACVPLPDIAAYGQALTKLFNSLSWSAEPSKLTQLDSNGTLFAVKLSDFGWVSGHWALIQKEYPSLPVLSVSKEIQASAGTTLPIINGDWLAAAATEPPLYYALLGLPNKLADVAKMNGVDVDQSIKSAAARRIAIRDSSITRGNRLAERHAGGRGAFWLIYDFATSTGDQDLFEHPLGPKATVTVKTPFRPDQIRAAFALPNGFFAYALFDGAGNRIDRALPGVEKPYAGFEIASVEPLTKVGANCFSCHASGIRSKKDDFRPFATNTTPSPSPGVLPPKDISDQALAMYSIDSETALLSSGDNDRYHAALTAVKIEPSRTVKGEEIVSALANHYRGGSDLKAAVAEAGVDREAFLKVLAEAKGPTAPLARRMQQGILSRADLDRLFAQLKGINVPEQTQGSGGFLRDTKSEIGLSVWLDQPRPAANDLVIVNAEADTDCYVTVVSVGADGKATVLFPNDFEPDNLLSAGKTTRIPGPDAPYQLRFKADGTETLLSRCSTSPVPPTGIEHDFERQRFSLLGNWENFIQDTLITEAELRRNPEKAERARAAKEQALLRQQDRGAKPERRPDTSPGRALRDGRSAVIIGKD